MYKVRVQLIVKRGYAGVGTEDAFLHRDAELPFAPQPGLMLRDGDWEALLREVTWNMSKGRFYGFVASDESLHRKALAQHRLPPKDEFKTLVEEYLARGWVRA